MSEPVQPNWLDQLSSTQRFVLQMGMAGVVCIMVFMLWYAYQGVMKEEINSLRSSVEQNEKRIEGVRQDARTAADAHGKNADALRQEAQQQRNDILKLANDQRLHDTEERQAMRVVLDGIAKRLEATQGPATAPPVPAKKFELDKSDK
jgi:F0F1-type ATP synthase membrane subunit b/b'